MHGARPLRSTRRLSNLMPVLPKWYKITNSAEAGKPTLVSIYDEIGMFGVSASEFVGDLRGIQGDLEVHISSPGGDVYDGIAIYNALRQAQQRGQVHVIIDGLAASAGSFIAQAASPGMLEIAPHAEVMIHDGFCMAIGNAKDMRELADQLDRASDNIAGIYSDRTGKPTAYWREKMRAETWYTDQQAVADGLADRILGSDGNGEARPGDWDLSVYAAARKPKKGKKGRQPTKADPDPDGDGDDDTTAEGDTDHDYVAPGRLAGPEGEAGQEARQGHGRGPGGPAHPRRGARRRRLRVGRPRGHVRGVEVR